MPVAHDTHEFEEEARYGAEHYVDTALLASIASGGTFDGESTVAPRNRAVRPRYAQYSDAPWAIALISSHLILTTLSCAGLGRWIELEDGTRSYVKDDDCVACLKDLQGFFRHDDPEYRHAFFAIHKYNFAKTDLVPLLVTYPDDYEVVYNTLKVCTHLTMQSSDINKGLVHRQFEVMRQVVEAFVGQGDEAEVKGQRSLGDGLEVVMTLLAEPLSKHPKMKDRDASLVELVIIFLRNLLTSIKVTQQDANFAVRESARALHGDLLRGFQRADVTELLVTIAQHARERPFRSQASVLLEIFLNVFQFSTPEQLVDVPSIESIVAKNNSLASAPKVSARERARNKKKMYQAVPQLPAAGANRTVTRFGPARQQFAGAVFMRRHKDHSHDVLVRHTPSAQELPGMSEAPNKKHAQSQKKKQYYMNDEDEGEAHVGGVDAYMALGERDVRLLHWKKDVLDRFLSDAYTPLVGQVFKEAKPGLDISRMEEDEFERFVRFVAFCTKYVRLVEEKRLIARLKKERGQEGAVTADLKDDAEGGAGTATGMDAANGETSSQGPNDDHKASPFACISSTMGWDAFHMVQVLFLISVEREVQKAKDKDLPYRSHVLLYSLGPLLREMLMTLDLARIAGNEADMQAADRLQRKLLHNDDRTGMLQVLTTLIREYKFHLHPRSHAVHLAEILHVVLATLDRLTNQGSFQVAKEVKKRKKPVKKIKQVKEGEVHHDHTEGVEGVGADKRVEIAVEDSANAGAVACETAAGKGQSDDPAMAGDDIAGDGPDANNNPKEDISNAMNDPAEAVAAAEHQEDGDDEEDDGEEARYVTLEHDFDPSKRLRAACAHPQIVIFYIWLLQGYRKNSNLTNDAIVSFLERVAGPSPRGMGLHCMLWQLSVIRTFHAIMSDNMVHKDPRFKRMLKLCIFVIRGLFERLCPDLSDIEKRRDEATSKLQELDQELEDLKLVHLGEDDVEAKLAGVRKDIEEAKVAAHEASVEIKMKEEVASLAFVELLFSKSSTVSESIAAEYNWKRHVSMSDVPDGAVQLGFASFRAKKPGEFTEEQTEMLVEYFEQCNGRKDCLSHLVFEFGGAFKKVHISRKLKELGLEKGKLTTRQRDMLHILAERYAQTPAKERYETIQEQLGGGFTARQVKAHMRKLGLIKTTDKSERAGKKRADSMSNLESGDSSDFDTEESDKSEDEGSEDDSDGAIDAEKAFDDMLADMDEDDNGHNIGNGDDGELMITDDVPTRPSRLAATKEAASPSQPPSPAHLQPEKERESRKKHKGKRKEPDATEEEDEAARAEAKRKALALLRSRHATQAMAAPMTLKERTGPSEPDATENATENVPLGSTDPSSPLKTFGRRLMKKTAVAETQQSEMGGFDELADF